jgi:hypothetical protein
MVKPKTFVQVPEVLDFQKPEKARRVKKGMKDQS